MPPKTLDQLTATGAAIFDPECMRNEPALAAKIAECIARWSNTEAVLGSLLARLMDSTDLTATAVYRNAGSWPARIKVLEAAAALKLDPDDNKLFGHILTLVRKAADKRHDLAHRVWGWCPELPGSLLLARSNIMPKWHTHHYLSGKGVPLSAADWGNPHSNTEVYSKEDLVEIEAEILVASDLVAKFVHSFDVHWPGYDRLKSELREHRAIKKLSKAG